MFIKSIVLDGFKSYGNRVEITGFDPEFNAITGLNGTGKSNILDAICFVLGITNLSNVRAGSLQELIYKHGQAGVTKATVSITFDNKDKKQCPIGYENQDEIIVTRQVVMGGKNKYLINGINVQNKRVSDLFCSIQLNVNNPHFLIMQGRITKVLNMKPPEILSMVEEAAGTRMYEAKKQAAQKTIEKKDAKLRELNDIIREDIAPKLQKLQDERAQFQEYQKVVRELENLTRLLVAYRYVTAEEKSKEASSKVATVQEDIKSKKENIEKNKKECKELDKRVTELNKKLDEESGSTLQRLEAELGAAERAEAGAGAAARAARDAAAEQARRARLLARALADDDAALQAKRAQLQQVSAEFEGLRLASSSSAGSLAAARERFLAVSAGLPGAGSLQDQLIAAKQEASEASTRISQSQMEKKHAEERLQQLQREFRATSDQFQRDQATIARQQAAVDTLQAELSALQFNEERFSQLKESIRTLQSNLRRERDAAESVSARLQRCDFHYTPPETNFDKSRVSGTICRLIDVVDPVYCTALETAAGGRLYNVVVDTEVTSKLLLQRGRLQSRTTIIPLNKISAQVIPRDVVQLAQQVGGSILVQLQSLKQMEQKIQDMEAELSQLQAEYNRMQQTAEKYSGLQQKHEMTLHELAVVKARLASTPHAQLHTEIEALTEQVEELTAAVERDKATQKETAARAAELEAKVKDIKGHREREFKRAELELQQAQEAAARHSSSWKAREQESETLRLELHELEAAAGAARDQLQDAERARRRLEADLPAALQAQGRAQEAVAEIQARISKHKSGVAERSRDLSALIHQQEQLLKTNSELELAIKELEYSIKELQAEAHECDQKIKSLEKEHNWIASEKQYFGSAGGLYDFAARKADIASQRVQQLQQRKDKLSRGLNARAHTLLGKEEEQYQDVMDKKRIVETDRAKLVQVMAELDEKKKKTLIGACEQVNRDFGAIFGSLLPGAQAALRPPRGLSVLDGLEVKVGFNRTWKESLGELSGGQRSLVALALVLAMLLFKPAPLYILDEVDAALDLSHTQNIGHMLKQHFKHSQFIIVSLKDGMFNNANVLFRTRFVDGMSSVQRTDNTRK